MSDKLTVTITGNNGVSRVFQEVANDAQKMGTGIERSGQMADQALQGVGKSAAQMAEQVETSNAAAGASAEKIGKAIGSAGLAFGAFTLIAGQAAGESEASSARMQTAFQNAGLAVEDYQGQINQLTSTGLHLAFDDEDVQDALSRFITQTGNVAKSMKDVQLAEDLARGTGQSLASATATVAAAEAGRTRGLAALVGNLGATATKEDYLAAAQQKYAGSAQAYATTNAAAFDRYKNSAENALEAIGGKLESLQMPILAVSTAAAALGPLSETLKGIADSEKAAELGGLAMDTALGPIGLAAGAIAAGAGILYLMTRTREYTTAAQTATSVTGDLDNMFSSIAATLDPAKATAIHAFSEALDSFVKDAATRQDDLNRLTDLQGRFQAAQSTGADLNLQISQLTDGFGKLTQAELQYFDANKDGVLTMDEVNQAVALYQANLDRLNSDQVKAVQNDISSLFSKSNLDFGLAIGTIQGWEKQLQSGEITNEQFVAKLDDAATNYNKYILASNQATSATAANTAAAGANGSAIQAQMEQYNAVNQSLNQAIQFNQANANATKAATVATVDNGAAIAAQMATYEGQNASLDQAIQFNLANTSAIKESTAATLLHQAATQGDASALAAVGNTNRAVALPANALTDAVKQQAQAMKDNEAAAQAAAQSIATYRQQLGEVHMVVNDGANQFAKHATVAGNALDSGNRVAIGNTNAIAQQSQGVADWADKLIGVRGVYAEIDKLLAKGTISLKQYNDAQSAEASILHNNAAIQRDVLAIQTDQAPLMAELTKNQRDYMDSLAQMPPQQQLVTLGFMDSAESAKALAAQQLAVSAASGELGKNGVATANKMIQAAAEADPVLEAMLQNMGLITVGADGTISVNYDDVTGGKSETGLLIDAINTLDADLKNIFHIGVEAGDVDAAYRITVGLNSQLDALQNRTITYSVVGNYSTTGTGSGNVSVGGSSDQATMGDGAGSSPGGGGFTDPFGNSTGADTGLRLGGVAGYARGGVVIRAGEAGIEGLTFPNGRTGLAMTDGLYNVPRGTYVDTAPATKGKVGLGGVHIANATFNFNGLTSREQISQQINEFALGGSR